MSLCILANHPGNQVHAVATCLPSGQVCTAKPAADLKDWAATYPGPSPKETAGACRHPCRGLTCNCPSHTLFPGAVVLLSMRTGPLGTSTSNRWILRYTAARDPLGSTTLQVQAHQRYRQSDLPVGTVHVPTCTCPAPLSSTGVYGACNDSEH
jgi:hypothetical protein